MRAVLAIVAAASLAAAGWFFVENRRLDAELVEARRAPPPRPAAASPEAEPEDVTAAAEPARRGEKGAAKLLGFVAKTLTSPPAPATNDANQPPDFERGRERRQQRLRDLLGRAPTETEEQYRARVAPLVATALFRPRQRVEDKRKEFETAAELTPEQRGELDGAISDARAELVALASKSVTAGDLTPYRRNSLGLLNFVGGAAGVADGFDAHVRRILASEQQGLLEDTGFDLIEYLGFTTPWETVTPPPPPPNL